MYLPDLSHMGFYFVDLTTVMHITVIQLWTVSRLNTRTSDKAFVMMVNSLRSLRDSTMDNGALVARCPFMSPENFGKGLRQAFENHPYIADRNSVFPIPIFTKTVNLPPSFFSYMVDLVE